jgi:hypothetical protein
LSRNISNTCHISVRIPNFGFYAHAYAFMVQRVRLRDYTPVESAAQSLYWMTINVRDFAGNVLSWISVSNALQVYMSHGLLSMITGITSILRQERGRGDDFWLKHSSQMLGRMITPVPSPSIRQEWTGSDTDQLAAVTLTDFDKTNRWYWSEICP